MTQEALQSQLAAHGARFAQDGIPLDFGDQRAEFQHALNDVALMQRSHEGRIELTERDRLALLHRISTNDVEHLKTGEGTATIFLNATGRMIDRVTVYNRGETVLLLTEPGRAQAFRAYLQRNVFFNDRLIQRDISTQTAHFAIHGPNADQLMNRIFPDIATLPPYGCSDLQLNNVPVFVARRKPISGTHWMILVDYAFAADVWLILTQNGAKPAGSLVYNALRIRAGFPGVGRELSEEYIPLEAGLWDEVNFRKGCYTGQEIIARMESRSKLAKVMVTLQLEQPVTAPTDLGTEDRKSGTLTSSVTTPDGEHLGIGFIRPESAVPGMHLTVGDQQVHAQILSIAGFQPMLNPSES